MNNLTLTLQMAINNERIKLRIQDLQRAQGYLAIAQEAARRYANKLKMIVEYDEAYALCRPWTLIETKSGLVKKAEDTKAAYFRCMDGYRRIIERELL